MRTRGKLATFLTGAALASTALVVGAAPASAAGECGAGYTKVGDYAIESQGRLEVYYSSSTGKNCAITRDSNPNSGFKAVHISVAGASGWADSDSGSFTYYAGPVYVSAPGKCIDVSVHIGTASTSKWSVHCG